MVKTDREIAVFVTILFVSTLELFALVVVYIAGMPEVPFWIGSVFGIGFGLIALAYLLLTWDPVHLRPKIGRSHHAMSWAGLVIIGGVVVGRLLAMSLGEEMQALIFGCTITWVVWTLGSMAIMAWWHRPRL